MSKKFHINPESGEPGECVAANQCRYGSDVPHYNSMQEARAGFEQNMAFESSTTVVLSKKASAKVNPLGLKELNKLAKETSDVELQKEMIKRGSSQTLLNLVGNENASEEVLKSLHEKLQENGDTDSLSLDRQVINHPNYPFEGLSREQQVRKLARKSPARQNWIASEDFNDSDADTLAEGTSNFSIYSGGHSDLQAILANPNNKLSEQKRIELAKTSATASQTLILSDAMPKNKFSEFDDNTWSGVAHALNDENKINYVRDRAKQLYDMGGDYRARTLAHPLAKNPNASSEVLEDLYNSEILHERDLIGNSKLSSPFKQRLTERSPEFARHERINHIAKKQNMTRVELAESLVDKNNGGLRRVERPNQRPGSTFNTYEVQLDKERIKKLHLSSSEVLDLYKSGYNVGAEYNSGTGVFRGSVDSSD